MSIFDNALFVDRTRKIGGFEKLILPETKQAVMLIKSPEKMGKTWLAMKFEALCNEPDVNLPVVRIDFRNPLDQLKITDHLAFIRLLRDRLNQPEYFRRLNATINRLTNHNRTTTDGLASMQAKGSRRIAELANEIQTVFNLNELEQQSLFLDVQFENLRGTTRFDKAFGLASYFARRGALAELFDMLTAERGHIDWLAKYEDLLNASADEMASIPSDVTNDTQFQDQNLNLVGLATQEIERAERLINEAFFNDMADLLSERGQAVFLLDAYESAPQVASDFIAMQLLVQLLDERLRNMVIVISGREIPDVSDIGIRGISVITDLSTFNKQYVREFMLSRDIPEDTGGGVDSVLLFSGGVPGILALMADQAKMALQTDDDFFD